jgi:hypothetical protein
MAENKESISGDLEKLALITDGIQNVVPDGVGVIVFELKPHDFYRVKNYFKQLGLNEGRFKIDISGVEVIFILEGSIEKEIKEEEKKPQVEVKKTFWSKLTEKLSRKVSSGPSVKS